MWTAWAGVFVQAFWARGDVGARHPDLAARITFAILAVFIASVLLFLTSTMMVIRRVRSDFARAAEAERGMHGARAGGSQEFRGAARLSSLFRASSPLARLRIEPGRLVVGMPLIGSIVIPAGNVMSVKPKRGFLSRGGLRIDTDIGSEYVTFFPMSGPDSVMRALQAAGYPCPTGPAT